MRSRNSLTGVAAFTATTDEITINVQPVYLEAQSDFMQQKFVFAYFVRIENHGTDEVQLLRRHWLISHGGGRVEEVEGEGVVGKQPLIRPGAFHEYNSFCVLDTMEGSMEGTYLLRRANGEYFRATIPKFILRAVAN
ncbi:MAG TPA: Co2+/Mg2+ efflux protein ApaG [Bacteroidota bacterium]|jgi:ApaG protein|nr:Co2+/Mg2+ efflux protein ApaG [Bacteroidota bacterium]